MDNYVTGGSGFLGSRLVSLLPGITECIPHGDIPNYFLEAFERIFFLSTYGNLASHGQHFDFCLKANVEDVCAMARNLWPFENEEQWFGFVSSSSVTLPQQTVYSRLKMAAEQIVLAMPIQACVVRPYSVIGVNEHPEHLIPTLIRSCMKGEKVNLVMKPVHDYVDVADVASGLVALADRKAGGIFEFGSGIATSNEEVLSVVEAACGKRANVTEVGQMREYDNADWVCRDMRAQDYGWKPSKCLAQSVKEMVEAFDERN